MDAFFNGTRGRSRTCDLFLRREALYPLSYASLRSGKTEYIILPGRLGTMEMCLILTGSTGRSPSFGWTPAIVRTLFIPSITLPKIVYRCQSPARA